MTPQGRQIADLVQGVTNTLAVIEANADFAAAKSDATPSTPSEQANGRSELTSQFSEVGLALLEAREAARRIRGIIGRLTEASAKVVGELQAQKQASVDPAVERASRIVVTEDDIGESYVKDLSLVPTTARDAARRLAKGERFDAIVCLRKAKKTGGGSKAFETIVRLGPTLAKKFLLMAGDATRTGRFERFVG
jgi:hypothetical protein